jgi:ribosome-binding protein aMBF1 (putative translation factor)
MGFREEQMHNSTTMPANKDAFLAACEELKLGRILAEEVILTRQQRGLSQKQLADRLGTQQSSISRLENYKALPSLRFLKQVADALDSELLIQIVPREEFAKWESAAG